MTESQIERGLGIKYTYTLPDPESSPLTDTQIKYLTERLEESIHNYLLKLIAGTQSVSMSELQTCVRGTYENCLARVSLKPCP